MFLQCRYFPSFGWVFVIRFPPLKQHVESSMEDLFSHTRPPCAFWILWKRCLSQLKRGKRLKLGLRDQYRINQGSLLCSRHCMRPTRQHSQWQSQSSITFKNSLDSHQEKVSGGHWGRPIGWLTSVCFGCTRQTDGLHFGAAGGFPQS